MLDIARNLLQRKNRKIFARIPHQSAAHASLADSSPPGGSYRRCRATATIKQNDKFQFTVSGSPYAPIGSPAALDLPSPRESAFALPVFPASRISLLALVFTAYAKILHHPHNFSYPY